MAGWRIRPNKAEHVVLVIGRHSSGDLEVEVIKNRIENRKSLLEIGEPAEVIIYSDLEVTPEMLFIAGYLLAADDKLESGV